MGAFEAGAIGLVVALIQLAKSHIPQLRGAYVLAVAAALVAGILVARQFAPGLIPQIEAFVLILGGSTGLATIASKSNNTKTKVLVTKGGE